MKFEENIEYFLKDHYKIKLHMVTLTLFLFMITVFNSAIQLITSNNNLISIKSKIQAKNFIEFFLDVYNYMIYPLSDNYYTTYSNNNLFMNSYWLSLFAGSILFSYSCFFYLNMNKVFNNEKIRIFYNSYKKQCKNVMIGSLFCFIILHYLSEMAQFPCSYIVFILTIAYIEIILIFFLCFKYYKSIIFMLLGNWFYYILFKENILPLKQSYNLLSILTNYKLIICFTIFSSLFFLRYEISEKTKYISKTTIVIFLKRMKKYIILVLLGNKKIWKRILDNIVISLSTYVVILSVWGFLNKVGFFLTSSLVNILLYKLY